MAIRREPQVCNTNIEISNCDIVHACGVAACAAKYRQVQASDSKDSEFNSKPPKKQHLIPKSCKWLLNLCRDCSVAQPGSRFSCAGGSNKFRTLCKKS